MCLHQFIDRVGLFANLNCSTEHVETSLQRRVQATTSVHVPELLSNLLNVKTIMNVCGLPANLQLLAAKTPVSIWRTVIRKTLGDRLFIVGAIERRVCNRITCNRNTVVSDVHNRTSATCTRSEGRIFYIFSVSKISSLYTDGTIVSVK